MRGHNSVLMILIRKALPADAQLISSFQVKMAMETENISLQPDVVREGVDAVVKDPVKGCYYIAQIENTIAGSLLVTYEWSDWRNGWILWIQSVYVLPEFRKTGIFKHLYNHVKQMVEQDPAMFGIRLYVDKTNNNAIKTYTRSGMNGNHYRLFEWMSSNQD